MNNFLLVLPSLCFIKILLAILFSRYILDGRFISLRLIKLKQGSVPFQRMLGKQMLGKTFPETLFARCNWSNYAILKCLSVIC